MLNWEIKEFQTKVRAAYGQERLNEALPIIQALSSKILIIKLHFMEVEEAFEGKIEEETTFPDLLKLFFSNDDKGQAIRLAELKYEANLVAAAQASHSISDNLAHLIYTTFSIPYTGDYRPKLERLNQQIAPGKIKSAIEYLLGLREYSYLKDFVNYNKHMSLVQSRYQIDTPSETKLQHGMKFKSFRSHPEKWGYELLKELKNIQYAHVKIGISVNQSIGRPL